MKGCSMDYPPTQVNVRRSTSKSQSTIWLRAWNILVHWFEECGIRISTSTRIDQIRASKPLSLIGIYHRIAYETENTILT